MSRSGGRAKLVQLAVALLGVVALTLAGVAGTPRANADYTAANLPDWAIGPFTRYSGNPILSPTGSGFESADVYNPGVRYDAPTDTFQMLYRGQASHGGASQIGLASSPDGYHFSRYSTSPVIPNSSSNEGCGVEDPRLYKLNSTYYSFFTAVHGPCGNGFDLNEATSTDLIHWTQLGPVETGTKDAAVVTDGTDTPVKINGSCGGIATSCYVMYYGQDSPGVAIAYSTDMIHWTSGGSINMHFPADYSPWEICVAVTNYQTVAGGPVNQNIVLFVAGNLMANGRWFYAASEVEFSRADPTQQLAQLSDPVLSPVAPYERTGQSPKAIWMNSITFAKGQWWMYYGAGDHVTALATAPLRPPAPPPPAGTPFSTSLETGQPLPDWVDSVDTGGGSSGGIANVGAFSGASSPETSIRQEATKTGTNALMYSGSAGGQAADYAYLKVFDLSSNPITVGPNTTLSYWIYPQSSSSNGGVSGNNSSCVALDFVFSDGTALRNLGAVDENGVALKPSSQCGHLTLDQWNQVIANVGTGVAAGKQIVRIDVGYDEPGGSGGYHGYLDDISITDAPPSLAADPASLVNPLIGTGNSGATDGQIDTFPGADVPFGMVQWSPDTSPDRTAGGGYSYSDSSISGFSLTHLSGPGCALYGDVPILPTIGAIGSGPGSTTQSFGHVREEQASPGFYQTNVGPSNNIQANILTQLTVTQRTGLGQFTYPVTGQANVLFKAGASEAGNDGATAQIVGNNEVDGSSTSGHFCSSPGTYTVYFAAQFNRPFASYGTWTGSSVTPGSTQVSDAGGGAYVTFDTSTNQTVEVKVGVSYVSVANARANLAAENTGWDFNAVKAAAHDSWNQLLSRMSVSGGSFGDLQTYYTALYHATLHPNLFSDANGQYIGFDGQVHTVSGGQGAQYANFSGWDVYRSQIPLLALLAPTQTGDMMQSLVNDATQGGWFDRWAAANDYTGILSGDSADAIISEAYALGVRNFDAAGALTQMIKGANQFPTASQLGQGWYEERPQLIPYLALGYMPNTSPSISSPVDIGGSATLEYATDDFAIAQLAQSLGDSANYQAFMTRAQNWQNLFNPANGYIQRRDGQGGFPSGDPTTTEIDGGNGQHGFAEGNSAQYTWMVTQNLHGLIAALGGNAAAVARLNTFFSQLNAGRIAPFEWAGNEPSFGTPWIYDYAGAPYRTQQVVRQIVNTLWSPTPNGEPGNEDLGAMSSWYVWAALGLYPETPGAPGLALGSPLFSQETITLPTGHKLVINASNAGDGNPYVQSLTVNGSASQKPWLNVNDLLGSSSDTTLNFALGSSANTSWGSDPANAPPSYSTGQAAAITSLSSSSVTVAPGGSTTTVNLLAQNATDSAINLTVTPTNPSGVNVVGGTFSVPADGQATFQLSVSATGGAAENDYQVPLQLSVGGQSLPNEQLTVVVAAAGSILRAYNNVGIAADGAQWTADMDGFGNSYSNESLSAQGLAPGATVSGLKWPVVPAGTPDNAMASGQTITVNGSPGASTLAFLGNDTNGPGSGTVTLHYTTGGDQTQTLGFSDWTLNGNPNEAPSYGNLIVATLPYHDCTCDDTETAFTPMPHSQTETTFVFLATVPLDPTRTLASVTLPNGLSNGHLHLFAVGEPQSGGATISSLSPTSATPGQLVTINGSGFGVTQGSGYVSFSNNSINWGAPGNAGTFTVNSWSDTQITFTVPTPSGTTNQWRVMPSSNATVSVHTQYGSVTGNQTLAIANSVNLSDYFNDIRVSPDTSRGCSGLNGTYFSSNALAASSAAITEGSTVTTGGFTFTWPSPANCYYDNVYANGQTILVPATTGATSLGLLGTAMNANVSGTLTVKYSDNTTQSVTAAFNDWCSGTTAANNTIVASMSYRNDGGNQQNIANTCRLFLDTITGLDPTKTVTSITLPSPGNTNMHIFGIAFNATSPTATVTASSGSPTGIQPVTFPVAFSAAVTDLTPSGVALGGTANLSGASVSVSKTDSQHFTVSVSGLKTDGSGDGTVTVQVKAGAVTGSASGNGNPISNTATVTWTTTAPTATVIATSASPTGTLPLTYSVVFNQAVTDLASSGVTVTGSADLSGKSVSVTKTDSQHFTISVSGLKTDGTGNGTVSVRVAANAVQNAVGNGNAASNTATVTYAVVPTISSLSATSAVPGDQITITGSGFAPSQGSGYVQFSNNGVTWGTPASQATFSVVSWSNTQIVFTVPTPSGANGQYRVLPGTNASVLVHTAGGSSTTTPLAIANTTHLADYFNDIRVSPDSNPGCSGLNLTYFSADALLFATPSIAPGGTVTAGGFTFTWPSNANCQYDNVIAAGQTIPIAPTAGATSLGLLGTGAGGSASGTLTVHYSDGSASTATAAFADWCSGNVATGNTPLTVMDYRNDSGAQQNHTCTLFVDTLTGLDPSKTVTSVTLPNPGNTNMHIFALALDAGLPSLNQSTVTASPNSVLADGSQAATITVRLKNASGANLTMSAGTVALATTKGTLSSVTDNGDGTYTATLTSTAAGTATVTATLDDGDGNGPQPLSAQATVTFRSVPVLQSAVVNGSSLTLAYDQALDAGSVPAASAFSVVGNSTGAQTPSAVAVSGSAVTLTLATVVLSGETLTVSYTVPGSHPLQSTAGDKAAALVNQAVTNSTAPPPAPTVTATSSSPANTQPLTYAVHFDQPVTGFGPAGVNLTGTANLQTASVGVSGSGQDYTLSVSGLKTDGSGDGTVSVQVSANAAQNAAGTGNVASNTASVSWDRTAPAATVTAVSSSPANTQPLTFAVAFSEPVSDLVSAGVNLSGSANLSTASVGVSKTDSQHFTVSVSGLKTDGSGNGTVSVQVTANAVQDSGGNGNIASNTATITWTGSPSARTELTNVEASLGAQLGMLVWAQQISGTTADLKAVSMIDNNHVWAVGANCTLLFFGDGISWTKDTNVPPSCTSTLTGIFVLRGAGPGFAVGAGGTILACTSKCNQATATWTAPSGGTSPPSTLTFTSVWAADPNRVYAVGTATDGTGMIWACSASCTGKHPVWANVTPGGGLPGTSLNGVAGAGGGLVVAVGSNGTVLICSAPKCSTSGTGWTALSAGPGGSVPSTGVTFNGVTVVDPNDVYAVGSASSGAGVIWACSANCDTATTGPGAAAPHAPPRSGHSATWADVTPSPAPSSPLLSVTGQGPDTAWAVGSGGMIWYCPGSCTTAPGSWILISPPSPTTSMLFGVDSTDQNHVWAVGAGGTIVATLSGGPSVNAIESAIGDLESALDPLLWSQTNRDGNHVDPAQGNKVFDDVKQTIQALMQIKAPPPLKGNPDWDVADMTALDQAMRLIGSTAIADNACSPQKANELATAQKELAAGDNELAAGHYDNAIDHYGNAWQHALKANGTACTGP